MSGTKFRIAIVDDHFAVRDGYEGFLSRFEYVSQVRTFPSTTPLLEELENGSVDLVLLDIQLQGESGLETCRTIKSRFRDVKVIMISTFHTNEYIVKAHEFRADGYLFKDSDSWELKLAIEKVLLQNESYYPTEAKEAIINQGMTNRILTERELKIIRYICEGKSNSEIGEILFRNEGTIAKHRQNIMNKIKVKKSIEIVNYAIKHGIYIPGSKEA